MKKYNLFLMVFFCTILLACSDYRYYAIQSNNASFNRYRTFAWLPVADTSHYHNDISDERIKDAVTAGLEQRKLSLQRNRPDLLVRYTIQVKDRIRFYNNPVYIYDPLLRYRGVARNRYGRYYYYTYPSPFPVYVGSEIEQVPYKEGTLIIDLIERRNHKVIWRGYGIGTVDDPERALHDIPLVVEGILNKLPIAPLNKQG